MMIAVPPMVGVPRFFWWVCGPSSRISWPKPGREKTLIRYGVSMIATARPMTAAMRMSFIADARSSGRPLVDQGKRQSLQAQRPGRLDQHHVSRLQPTAQVSQGRLDVWDQHGLAAPGAFQMGTQI